MFQGLRSVIAISWVVLMSASAIAQDNAAEQEIAVSPDSATPYGKWHYRQLRDDTPVICRYKGPTECITHILRVENASGDTLECEGRMTYDGVNNENTSTITDLRVVLPSQSQNIMRDHAKREVSLVSATVDCKPRPQRAGLKIPPQCKFQAIEAPSLLDFYPDTARRLAEEGPVDVYFTLDKPQSHPSAVTVAGSSLSPRLDGAAIKYVESMTLATKCPGTRYELRVRFKLDD